MCVCVCVSACVWVARIGWRLVAKQGCRTQWISKILLLYNLLCHTVTTSLQLCTWDNILSLNLSALNRPNSSGPKGRSLRSRLETCKVPSWVEVDGANASYVFTCSSYESWLGKALIKPLVGMCQIYITPWANEFSSDHCLHWQWRSSKV